MNDDSNYGDAYRNGEVTITRTSQYDYTLVGPHWVIYFDTDLGPTYINDHDPIWD